MKKKLMALGLTVVLGASMLAGCAPSEVKSDTSDESRFMEVERADNWRVVYDKETLVMYAVSYSGYNCGNFTLLVDQYGNPLTYKSKVQYAVPLDNSDQQ